MKELCKTSDSVEDMTVENVKSVTTQRVDAKKKQGANHPTNSENHLPVLSRALGWFLSWQLFVELANASRGCASQARRKANLVFIQTLWGCLAARDGQ